jgi:ATP-dependent helicase/DNAse subunit B
LEVPPPLPLDAPIESLRVTDFSKYMACPYRFYLQRLLRLQCVADDSEELDGGQFGDLLHTVLQRFGDDKRAARIERESDLADWLTNCLFETVNQRLGAQRLPIVNVQIEQLRLRLQAFAEWQAPRTRAGWQIHRVECDECRELRFGGESIQVEGRIDRVDYHPDRGEWLVLDYKSSDSGDTPQKTHRKREAWIDLQLPLYRRLMQEDDTIDGPVQVGYILLPRDLKAVGESLPEWGDADWASADVVAAEIVAGIRQERFWPPSEELRWSADELAAICQANILGRRLGAWPVEVAS